MRLIKGIIEVIKAQVLGNEVKSNWRYYQSDSSSKETSSEDIIPLIEETQVSDTQSNAMNPSKFEPAVFFSGWKASGYSGSRRGWPWWWQWQQEKGVFHFVAVPTWLSAPFWKYVELKRPKYAKSVTALQSLQTKWYVMFHRLVDYKQVHGDGLVPNQYKSDIPLGLWVSTQCRQVCFSFAFWYYMQVWQMNNFNKQSPMFLSGQSNDEGYLEVNYDQRVSNKACSNWLLVVNHCFPTYVMGNAVWRDDGIQKVMW